MRRKKKNLNNKKEEEEEEEEEKVALLAVGGATTALWLPFRGQGSLPPKQIFLKCGCLVLISLTPYRTSPGGGGRYHEQEIIEGKGLGQGTMSRKSLREGLGKRGHEQEISEGEAWEQGP